MLDLLQPLLVSQFEASLTTLGLCIDKCPGELWHKPVAKYPFCQTAYHALFFTDAYLGLESASFRGQEFHRANPGLFGDYEQMEDHEPVCFYEKSQVMAELHLYNIRHIQHRAAQLILRLRLDSTIDIPWIGAGWRMPEDKSSRHLALARSGGDKPPSMIGS